MSQPSTAPLLVTLRLDEESQDFFEQLRRNHFPPERNHIAAHLTLFHHLPGMDEARVKEILAEEARHPGFAMSVESLASIGGGTIYRLPSPELMNVRAALAAAFAPWLTRQDSQTFRPHVTVQNKVSNEAARALLTELSESFEPFEARAEGLILWRYLGGPWEHVADFAFAEKI